MRLPLAFLMMLTCTAGLWTSSAAAQTKKATGLIFLDQGQYQSIPPAPPPMAGQPPATVDLSTYGYFPEPGDQGNQGSCVGWAVAYGLKSYQKNREFRLQNVPANFRFSPAFVYNQVKQSTCDGGSSIRDALNIIESQGALPLDTFAYDDKICDKLPTEAQVQSAWEYRIARWMRVNVQSLAEMKAQLVRGFPIVVAMQAYESFEHWPGGGVYKTTKAAAGAYTGGHALVVVGYADQLRAFKVLNSWGTKWGDAGYAWIDYTTFQSMTLEGYVTIDIFLDRIASTAGSTPVAFGRPAVTTEAGPGPVVASPAPTPQPPAAKARAATAPAPTPPPTPPTPPALQAPKAAPVPVATKPPVVLTPAVLTASVRSTTEPKILFKSKGYDVQPYSVWLDLPDTLGASIAKVEYWFNHPSYSNPKRSVKDSSIFLATWRGYGCIADAKVVAFLKNGSKMEAPFDLCGAQTKF